MSKNKNLHSAKKEKNDEFYTQLSDIEKELKHYKSHFVNQVVFCNCDDPEWSNFWKYFKLNFEYLQLKKLISTHYNWGQPSYKLEMFKDECGEIRTIKTPLKGDGDFRSPECVDLLKESDIVVTNPPFSLFREYVSQLMEHDKKFIIIGSQNAFTYKEIFPLIKSNKLWLGYGFGRMDFNIPEEVELVGKSFRQDKNGVKYKIFGNICWYTNLIISKRQEELILYKLYNEKEYPKYDNYDAIEVSKVNEIPVDYNGVMGVPVTFLTKYNPEQFEIIKFRKGDDEKDLSINGKCPYFRILIRRK